MAEYRALPEKPGRPGPDSDFVTYLRRAEACERRAAETPLPNVRDRELVAAAKWRVMAELAERVVRGAPARAAANEMVVFERESCGHASRNSKPQRSWSDEEVRLLRQLVRKDAPVEDIALEMNRTAGSVRAKVLKEGLPVQARAPSRRR